MMFYLKNKAGTVDAKGNFINGKFIVLKGSKVEPRVSDKFRGTKMVIKRRSEKGILVDYTLQKDYEFYSPSTAGEFVLGTSCNGRIAWKDEKGRSIKDIDRDNE